MTVGVTQTKETLAWLTRFRPVQHIMRLGIRLLVPKRRIGAGVVLVNDKNEVLLLRHSMHGNAPWGLPAGYMDRWETPAECALRELEEETGLTAQLEQPILIDRSHSKTSDLDIVYRATEPKGEIVLSFEIIEARWFRPDSLPTRGVLPKTRKAVRLATQNPQASGF